MGYLVNWKSFQIFPDILHNSLERIGFKFSAPTSFQVLVKTLEERLPAYRFFVFGTLEVSSIYNLEPVFRSR